MKEKVQIEILEAIEQYIRGELSQEEIDELWIIFLQYPEYFNWFETELHLRNLIRKGKRPGSANENLSGSSSAQTYRGWLYAAAAAVMLAIGLQFFVLHQPETVENLAIAEINQSHFIGADVLRSDNSPAVDNSLDEAFNKALATAYLGETESAIEQFEEILPQIDNDQQLIWVSMNLGILFYNDGEYESAKNHFQAVTEIGNLQVYQEEKAWWFLGNACLNLNQPYEAREAVFNSYSLNGRYQAAALALLKKLDLRLGIIPSEEAPEKPEE